MKRIALLCVLSQALFLGGCGEEQPGGENGKPVIEKQTPPPAEDNRQDENAPEVVETTPADGSGEVDPTTTEIKIVFSRDMLASAYSPRKINGFDYPKIKSMVFQDARTFVMKVELEGNKKYAIGINRNNSIFRTEENTPVNPFTLKFTTDKDYSRIYGWRKLEKKRLGPNEAHLNTIAPEGNRLAVTILVTKKTKEINSFQGSIPVTSNHSTTVLHSCTTKVLEVRKNRIHKMEKAYGTSLVGEHLTISTMPGREFPSEKKLPITDKKYVVERENGGYYVTSKGRGVSDKEKLLILGEVFVPDCFPKDKIVGIGETWKAKGKWIDGLVGIFRLSGRLSVKSSDIEMKLHNITENEDGDRIAEISLDGCVKVEWAEYTGSQCDYKLNGDVSFNLTKRYCKKINVTGSSTFSGSVKVGGIPASIERESSLKAEYVWFYFGDSH